MSGDDEPVVRRTLRIEGAVQGVGFRAGCARAAERAGVSGLVRNLADGAVEAVVEGRPDAVETVVAWCRSGPRAGRVDRAEVTDEEPTGEAGFSIEG